MTQNEKDLLLKDLCGRLPYGVKVQYKGNRYDLTEMHKDGRTYLGSYNSIYGDWHCSLEFEDYPKPYLRPMSSMTDEELIEFLEIKGKNLNSEELRTFRKREIGVVSTLPSYSRHIDWLNEHHFDYRGLIEKGLAIAVTKENNPYEKEQKEK